MSRARYNVRGNIPIMGLPNTRPIVFHPRMNPAMAPPMLRPAPAPPFVYPFMYTPLAVPAGQQFRPNFELQAEITKQIDYYFSTENLVKDIYLRQRMDKEGWVCVGVISDFKKVKSLTCDRGLVLQALRSSSDVVEVQGTRIRKRCDWERWVIPPSVKLQLSQMN